MYELSSDPLFSNFRDHLGLWVKLCTRNVHLSHTTQTCGSSLASKFSLVYWRFCSASAKHILPSLPKSPIRAVKLAAHLAKFGVPKISVIFRVPVLCNKMSYLSLLNFFHSKRMCATDSTRPRHGWHNIHRFVSLLLIDNKNSLRAIFPVHICMIREETAFFRPLYFASGLRSRVGCIWYKWRL